MREDFTKPTNPYHYALHCLGGKWKMTILHEIYTYGVIHFNKTLKVLPISEKVLSQQLMLMYGKEASNRKQEIDRQHYTIPNQRPKDKHCGKI